MALFPADTPKTNAWRMVPLYHFTKTGGIMFWEVSFDEKEGKLYTASGTLFTKKRAAQLTASATLPAYGAALNDPGLRKDVVAALIVIDEDAANAYNKVARKPVPVNPKASRTMREQGILECRARRKKHEDRKAATDDIDALLDGRYVAAFRVQLANTYFFPEHPRHKPSQLTSDHFAAGVLVQRKEDGNRLIIHIDDKGLVAETRTGQSYAWLDDIKANARILLSYLPPHTYLDGEITHPDGLQTLRTVVGKSRTRNVAGESQLTYLIFDIYIPGDGAVYNLGDRRRILTDAYAQYTQFTKTIGSISLLESHECHSLEELRSFYKTVVASGGEGVIVRKLAGAALQFASESIYEPAGRSDNLLKIKPREDAEGVIVAVNRGIGTHDGCAIFTIRMPEGGEFGVSAHGTVEESRELYNHAATCLGRTYKYSYSGMTLDGLPREVVAIDFRDDD